MIDTGDKGDCMLVCFIKRTYISSEVKIRYFIIKDCIQNNLKHGRL